MSYKLQVAIKCFVENCHLFADPDRDPEKFNLYTGLANLAEALEEIERKVDLIQGSIP